MRDGRPATRLDRMQSFMLDYQALRLRQRQARLDRMGAFLHRFAEQHRQSWSVERRFNVFQLLRVEQDEVRHSRFLAWLLDADSGHGQGSAFLMALARTCELDISPEAMDYYRVRTEWSGTESIIDVLAVRKGHFLIFLENKILAAEGPDQIDREYRDMRRLGAALRVPKERQLALFLTPTGRAPTSGDASRWKAISYGDLAAGFRQLLPGIAEDKVRYILQDWLETVTAFGGSDELAV